MDKICVKCGQIKTIDLFVVCYYLTKEGKKSSFRNYCKECDSKSSLARYEKNKEAIKAKKRETYPQNKEKILANKNKEYYRVYAQNRRKDPLIRVIENLRRLTHKAFREFSKGKRSEEILGCKWEVAKQHLESQFSDGMSWDNYGIHGWHIDHIIPLSSAKTVDEAEKLCHYTNLQPLWAIDNIKKGAKNEPSSQHIQNLPLE